jgi:hypothetical protein
MIMNSYDLTQILEAAAHILQAIAWPIATIVIVFWFRPYIARLILKLRSLKLFGETGPTFDFGRLPNKQAAPPKTSLVSENPVNATIPFSKDKYGNIYWVGHDLLWTVAVLLNQGKREQILEGLYQSKHHLNEVGFHGTPIENRLHRLYRDAEQSSVSDWTNEKRIQVAQEVQSIARELGGSILVTQPGFKSHPA